MYARSSLNEREGKGKCLAFTGMGDHNNWLLYLWITIPMWECSFFEWNFFSVSKGNSWTVHSLLNGSSRVSNWQMKGFARQWKIKLHSPLPLRERDEWERSLLFERRDGWHGKSDYPSSDKSTRAVHFSRIIDTVGKNILTLTWVYRERERETVAVFALYERRSECVTVEC